MPDENIIQEPVIAPELAQPAEPVIEVQPAEISSHDLPPEAPEAPRDDENIAEVIMTTPENTPVEAEISEIDPVIETAEIPENPVNTAPNLEPTAQPAQTQTVAQTSISPVVSPQTGFFISLLAKARETIQFRKRKKLDKIMKLITEKGKVSNDDIQKLLYISDATATRYLDSLEKEGRVKQVGKTGKAVFYSKV